ncbi:DoxX family protein [Leptospira ryugenii]|uniref:DoxX family protein n=1 Tax=Leptospira ryugenii TaxID=1917863 RepID=UPI000D595FB4|nr:DoxX family protein [Leptospira ryugenii]
MKWIGTGLLGFTTLGCLVFGGMKVIGAEQMLQNMANLHYGEGFTRLLGLLEVVLGISIWFSKYRLPSLVILFGIFSGAIGSHLGHGDVLPSIAPASLFFVMTLVLFFLHPRTQFGISES